MTRIVMTSMAIASALVAGSCIQLRAPTDPIVIDLNVRIDQEVRLQLLEVADELISDNPDLF